MNDVGGLLFIAFTTAFGIGSIAWGYRRRAQVRASQSWIQTTAKITKAEIKDGGESSDTLEVAYEYAANGVHYTGQRIGFSRKEYFGKGAQAALLRYPIGQSVTAYFNPADPGSVVLSREAPFSLTSIIFGCGFLAWGLFVAVWMLMPHAAQVEGANPENFQANVNPAEPRSPTYTGYFDPIRADCSVFSGWAKDTSNPSAVVGVKVEVDGFLPINANPIGVYREGIGRYEWDLNFIQSYHDGKQHAVHVFYAGTRQELPNSPQTFPPPTNPGCK